MRLPDVTREESVGLKTNKQTKPKCRSTPLRDQEKRQMRKRNREQEIESGGVYKKVIIMID